MYSKSVKSGYGYDTSKKAICILIADFKIDSLKEIPELYYGYIDGIREGENKRNKEIANRMLKKNMSIEDIIEITQLTKEEIQKLN